MSRCDDVLEFVFDGRLANRLALDHGKTYQIGRDPKSDLFCHDPFCELAQVEIVSVGSKWVLRDVGSANGTTVNGQAIHGERTLQLHDTIRVGAFGQFTLLDLKLLQVADDSPRRTSSPKSRESSQQGRWLTWVPERRVEVIEPQATLPIDIARSANLRTAQVDGLPLEELFFFATDLNSHAVSGDLRKTSLANLAEMTVAALRRALPGLQFAGVYLDAKHPPQREPTKISTKKSKWLVSDEMILSQFEKLVPALELMAATQLTVTDYNFVNWKSTVTGGRQPKPDVICTPIEWDFESVSTSHRWVRTVVGCLVLVGSDLPVWASDYAIYLAKVLATSTHSLQIRLETEAEQKSTRKREQQDAIDREFLDTDFVGSNPSINKIKQRLVRLAKTDLSVLILGESGTGKEVVAKALHRLSHRASGPFVPYNCAAFHESLADSTLFGYERGAFTGAEATRPGVFEQASGGTLFLDEIGELPLPLQAKLLRVLEEGKIRRVGGDRELEVDVRVLTATNRPLEQMCRQKEFREDLLFRIDHDRIEIPPMRERSEDIEALCWSLMNRVPLSLRLEIEPEAIEFLKKQRWPGNVRQLRTFVQRVTALVEPGTSSITLAIAKEFYRDAFVSAESTNELANGFGYYQALKFLEFAQYALQSRGTIAEAAKLMDMTREGLSKRISREFANFPELQNHESLILLSNKYANSRKRQ